jgi:hypothetical protein
LQERYTQRGQAFQAIAQTHTAMMAWLQHGKPPGTVCEDFDGEPKLNKGEDILAAIEKLRRRGRELKADLARISAAPFPSSHAKPKMRQEIEALAQRGIPSMALLVEHDREGQWPTTNLRSAIFNAQTPLAAVETTDTLALFAWLHRHALIARLDALISDEADDAASLWHEARERQAAEVAGDLLDVERQEATMMFRGWADGLSIQPRPDLAPAALLNVVLITPPPVLKGGGSSPERAGYDLVGGRR